MNRDRYRLYNSKRCLSPQSYTNAWVWCSCRVYKVLLRLTLL